MAAMSTTHLSNGHLLTVVDGNANYRVEERNECGTFLHVCFSAYTLAECERWVERAVERGYALRPTVPANEPVVRDAAAWRRVAAEGRRYA